MALNSKIPTVLIAEDDKVLQELYLEKFQEAGVVTLQAFDGFEAEHLLAQNKEINLLVLDLMMPGVSGQVILGKLTEGNRNHLPVVVVSAIAETSDDLADIAPGKVLYIAKGEVSLRVIVESIKAYLERL